MKRWRHSSCSSIRFCGITEYFSDRRTQRQGIWSTHNTASSKKVKLRQSPNSVSRQLWNTFPRHRLGFEWGQSPGGGTSSSPPFLHLRLLQLLPEDRACKSFKLHANAGEPLLSLVSTPLIRTDLTRWSNRETTGSCSKNASLSHIIPSPLSAQGHQVIASSSWNGLRPLERAPWERTQPSLSPQGAKPA